MSGGAATEWFSLAAAGDLRLPADPNLPTAGDGARLSAPPIRLEPPDGSVSAAPGLPFLPKLHGPVRSRALLGKVPTTVEASLTEETVAAWIRSNVFIDLDLYPKYLGALLEVHHDPVIRSVHPCLASGQETELIRIQHWPRTSLDGYRLFMTEQRMLGVGPTTDLPAAALSSVSHTRPVDRTGHVLMSPDGNAISWMEPTSYLRGITYNIDFVHERRRIIRTHSANGEPADCYDVNLLADGMRSTSLISGTHSDGQETSSSRVWQAEQRRARRRAAGQLGLRWFDDEAEAKTFFRELIGSARRLVEVVDAYFGPEQVLDYLGAVARTTAEIKVLTSNLWEETRTPWLEMARAVELARRELRLDISVRVMRGGPILHDRFITIDERTWFTGNSFNSVGRRASMMMEVPDPEFVARHLRPMLDTAKSLSDVLKLTPDTGGQLR